MKLIPNPVIPKADLVNPQSLIQSQNRLITQPCLKHLGKSSHTLKLPYKKTEDLVKFLKDTGSRPVLPLELTIKSDECYPNEVVSMLLDVIEPTCFIAILDIGKMYKARWIDFYPFLEKISPGHRCLSLPDYFFGSNDVAMEEITFPKLRILRMSCPLNMKSIFDSYSYLITRCPALEVLEVNWSVGTCEGGIELVIPVQRVKSLSVDCTRDRHNLHVLLNQIRTAEGGSKLETFRYNPYSSIIHPTYRPDVLKLLHELAPNLRHFFHSIRSLSVPLISQISFPMLTRLDVAIELSYEETRPRLLHMHLRPSLLPALTTLAIPIGRYLVTASKLSTVRHLTLKAPTLRMSREIIPIDYKGFFSHLFGVCPNVQKVNIEASIRGPSTWISELLQCSEAVGIEELGVWNYTRDWIGETSIALIAAPQPESSRITRSMARSQLYSRPILSNVQKIRLSQGKYSSNYSTYRGDKPEILELDFSSGMPRHSNSHEDPPTPQRFAEPLPKSEVTRAVTM